MTNKYKKLVSNSAIFAIGSLGSKLITFFMVPLYTHYLTTGDYGTTDLITTIVGLLTPLLTLSATESAFRFAMIKSESNGKVLSNGMLISVFGLAVVLVISPFLIKVPLAEYVLFLSYLSAIELMLQQFARGIGQSALFAKTGILMTLLTVGSNLILIVLLGWKLNGFLVSLVLAQIGGIVYLVVKLRAWCYLGRKFLNSQTVREMLEYSVPLIPNQISWWMSNSASKVFIAFFLGTAANGLYAVANKLPSLISVFTNVFSQAWQISAVEEYKKSGGAEFFSKILSLLTILVCVGVLVLSGCSRIFVLILSNNSYLGAVKVVPWLSLAVAFSTISSFLGTIYSATMKTGYLFLTTFFGAVINVVANLVMIPIFGLSGAGIGAYLSFLVVAILRYRNAQKFLEIKLDWFFLAIVQILVIVEYIGQLDHSSVFGNAITLGSLVLGLVISAWKLFTTIRSLKLKEN